MEGRGASGACYISSEGIPQMAPRQVQAALSCTLTAGTPFCAAFSQRSQSSAVDTSVAMSGARFCRNASLTRTVLLCLYSGRALRVDSRAEAPLARHG